MAGVPDVFSFVQTELDGPFANSITQQTTSSLTFITSNGFLRSFAAMVIVATLVLAIIGDIRWQEMVKRLLAVSVVVAVITNPAKYNQFVTQPILTTVPNLIANTFSHGEAGTIPAQFTSVSDKITRVGAQLRTQASPSYLYVPERLEIGLAGQLSDIVLIVTFGIWFCIKIWGGLLCIAGAIAIALYVFKTTRHVSESFLCMALGQILATILISASIQICLTLFTGYMQLAGDLPIGAGGFNVSEGILVLSRIVAVLFLGLFMSALSVKVAFGMTRSGGALSPDAIKATVIRTITAGRV